MIPNANIHHAAHVSRDEFQEVFDFASRRFGADSAAALLLGARLSEIESALEASPESTLDLAVELATDQTAPANGNQQQESAQVRMLTDGLAKSPVLMVGLGFAVLTALTGLSTLFIGMLAAKWLTF